jgi:hypothetical protein
MANEVLGKIYRERANPWRKFFANLECGLAAARQEGIAIGRQEAARAMLSRGVALERVIKCTGLTEADLVCFVHKGNGQKAI